MKQANPQRRKITDQQNDRADTDTVIHAIRNGLREYSIKSQANASAYTPPYLLRCI
jgi:hypothetical protein